MIMPRQMILLLFLLSLAVPVLAAPQVEVEQLNYDFGEVYQGDQVEYVYRFRNVGDQVLELGRVRTSCGCTAALLSAKRVAPGDSGELKARFDSTRFHGAVSKSITLETNDPQHSELVFGLNGKILVELQMRPERVSWGLAKEDQQLESIVIISNRGQKTVNLQPPQVTNTRLTAELSDRQLPPGGQVELRVRGQLGPETARISGYVVIATDYKAVPQLRVPVTVRLAK